MNGLHVGEGIFCECKQSLHKPYEIISNASDLALERCSCLARGNMFGKRLQAACFRCYKGQEDDICREEVYSR